MTTSTDAPWSPEHAVAIHEAAHAVVSLFERVPFANVTITTDTATSPRTHCVPTDEWFANADRTPEVYGLLQAEATCAVAGKLAEYRWTKGRPGCPVDWLEHISLDAHPDYVRATILAGCGSISEADGEAWLRYIEQRAWALLSDPELWHIIQVVAEKLLDQQEMSRKQVGAAVIDRAPGDRRGAGSAMD